MNEEELWEIEEHRRSYHADEFPWPYVDRLTVALRECWLERDREGNNRIAAEGYINVQNKRIPELQQENEWLRGHAVAYQAFVHEISEHEGSDSDCEYDPCYALRLHPTKGVPHDHPEYVEGCFRCDLSAQEKKA